MKACKDIDFLDSYWNEAKRIADNIKDTLPNGIGNERKPVFSKGGIKMYIVKFSDLKDTWLPKDIIYGIAGKSQTLSILADKIHYMIHKGRANDVKPMVESICNNTIKKLTQISGATKKQKEYSRAYHNEHLGYGHFRWNRQAHTLNVMEIRHLKEFFKL